MTHLGSKMGKVWHVKPVGDEVEAEALQQELFGLIREPRVPAKQGKLESGDSV